MQLQCRYVRDIVWHLSTATGAYGFMLHGVMWA